MKKTYYIKQGRRYVPVAEYDNELLDSFPKGASLVLCYPGGSSRRFNIDPNYAAMIAAGRIAEDAICKRLMDESEIRPKRRAMTQNEIDAWNNLVAVWGDDVRILQHRSARDVAEAGVKAMMEEADKLMKNPTVRKAYENFLLVCQLTKETEK